VPRCRLDPGETVHRLLWLVCLCFAGCGPYVLTVKGLCKSVQRTIPAAPVSGVRGTVSPSFTLNLADVIPQQGDDRQEIFLEKVTVTAQSGVSNLDFVESVILRATESNQNPALQLASYTRAPAAPSSSAVELPGSDTDLFGYLSSYAMTLEMDITGIMPTVAWTVDVEGCFTLKRYGTRDIHF
jgi:hypothetical protein